MRTLKRVAIALAMTGLGMSLTGCAYFNVGEEEFNCSGMPDSAYCHSARDVYNATNSGEVPSRVGPDGAYNEDCDNCSRSEGRNFNFGYEEELEQEQAKKSGQPTSSGATRRSSKRDEVIDNYVAPRLPDQPVPIRTPAVVMRIWVAPYIDDKDDLMAPGYVYTEIEPRRWIYGEQNYQMAGAFSPLEATATSSVPTVTTQDSQTSTKK